MESDSQLNKIKKNKAITEEEKEKYKQMSVKINHTFKEYYQVLLNMQKEIFEEFFIKSSKKLPITFRINKINNYCDFVDHDLQEILKKNKINYKNYNWNNLDNIYEIENSEKDKIPFEIKSILIRENDLGILRQELVSMIPVSLVDIQEDSIVMDMCAAPGNKSVQILEIIQEKARDKGILPTGALISNELDFKRGEKLVHFLQSQPTINVIATQCPAQDFPVITDENLRPDIIFCDVPCSGDGTLRKNKGLRKRWRPDYALKNHQLQIEILENSIRLCKIGGTIVYSTCSINPIENEAVIAYVAGKYRDCVELTEINSRIKDNLNLKFSEGLVKWKIAYDWTDNKNIQWAHTFDQVKKNKSLVRESMFHEIYTQKNFQNNIYFSDPLNLRRTIRFYSHQNDSGCFYVAVIKKTKEIELSSNNKLITDSIPLNNQTDKMLSIKDDLSEFMDQIGIEDRDCKNEKTELCHSFNENQNDKVNEEIHFDKFVKFSEYTDNFSNLNEFFNFSKDSNILLNQLYTLRTTSTKILLFSKKLASLAASISRMNVTILHAGLVCFTKERKELKCKYRISHYGGIILEKYIQNQKIDMEISPINEEFVVRLIHEQKLKFEDISQEIREKLNYYHKGSLIIIYDSIVLVCRKGKNNLSVMIPQIQLNNISSYVDKYIKIY